MFSVICIYLFSVNICSYFSTYMMDSPVVLDVWVPTAMFILWCPTCDFCLRWLLRFTQHSICRTNNSTPCECCRNDRAFLFFGGEGDSAFILIRRWSFRDLSNVVIPFINKLPHFSTIGCHFLKRRQSDADKIKILFQVYPYTSTGVFQTSANWHAICSTQIISVCFHHSCEQDQRLH